MSDNSVKDVSAIKEGKEQIDGFLEKVGGLKHIRGSSFALLNENLAENLGEEEEADNKSFKGKIKVLLKENGADILIGILYTIILALDILFSIKFFNAAVYLDTRIINQTAWSFTGITLFCFFTWMYSTSRIFWCFYNRKFFGLFLVILSVILRLSAGLFTFFYSLFIPFIAKLTVTELMTESKIAGLGWIATIIPTALFTVILLIKIFGGIQSDANKKLIRTFKISHYVDLKPRSKYDYDVEVVRDLSSGSKIRLRMHDRYMHGAVIGATGTAKTSSVLLPMIAQDLDTKVRNEDAQKRVIASLVKQGKVYLAKSFIDLDYSHSLLNTVINPVPGFEKIFEKKVLKYKSAGITVVAPDPSLTDDVYELCKSKGIKCNRIDPVHKEDGSIKEGSIGINPFVISPLIEDWAKRKEIVKRATLTADIMQIMFEMGTNKGDPYFSSVNRVATTTAAMAVMLAHPLVYNGEAPKLSHVRDIMNDFGKLERYLPALAEINKQHNKAYQPIIDIIRSQFLNNDKFFEHCSGLRIQLNNFLLHPDIERILCADNTIDMDMILKEGQVSAVNIEWGDLGPIDSPCFGLFVTVSMINAVLRRKGNEWTRLPHFWTIDELPIIINPSMESCFVLFRKFRTAMSVALQTLDQMEKTPYLKYLRGVILNSCGYHVVFGRTNVNDQETYSTLGGVIDKITSQTRYSQTALSVENPTLTMQKSYETEEVARVSTDEIRNRDFQEVTFFRTEKGRAVPPVAGRVDFLKNKDKSKKERLSVDWDELYKTQPYNPNKTEETASSRNETDKEKSLPIHNDGALLNNSASNVYVSGMDNNIRKKFIIDTDSESRVDITGAGEFYDEAAANKENVSAKIKFPFVKEDKQEGGTYVPLINKENRRTSETEPLNNNHTGLGAADDEIVVRKAGKNKSAGKIKVGDIGDKDLREVAKNNNPGFNSDIIPPEGEAEKKAKENTHIFDGKTLGNINDSGKEVIVSKLSTKDI